MSTIILRSTGLDTISSTDISWQYAKVSALVKVLKAPLAVTKNGKTEMVIMNPDLFMGLLDILEDYEDKISVMDYEASRANVELISASEVYKDIEAGEYEKSSC